MGIYFDTSTKGNPKGGVSAKQKRHNRWRAEIVVSGKKIRLGRFISKQDAQNAYDLAKKNKGKTNV